MEQDKVSEPRQLHHRLVVCGERLYIADYTVAWPFLFTKNVATISMFLWVHQRHLPIVYELCTRLDALHMALGVCRVVSARDEQVYCGRDGLVVQIFHIILYSLTPTDNCRIRSASHWRCEMLTLLPLMSLVPLSSTWPSFRKSLFRSAFTVWTHIMKSMNLFVQMLAI